MKDLISHQLVNYLEGRGVTHIFGLCGHTNIAVLTALEKSSIKFVNTRHEQVAAHAADGYPRYPSEDCYSSPARRARWRYLQCALGSTRRVRSRPVGTRLLLKKRCLSPQRIRCKRNWTTSAT